MHCAEIPAFRVSTGKPGVVSKFGHPIPYCSRDCSSQPPSIYVTARHPSPGRRYQRQRRWGHPAPVLLGPPGANPFMGDVVAAVDRYTDIPCRDARQAQGAHEEPAARGRRRHRARGHPGKAEYEPRSATCTSARQHLPHRHPREGKPTTQSAASSLREDGQRILVPTPSAATSAASSAAKPARRGAGADDPPLNVASSTRVRR